MKIMLQKMIDAIKSINVPLLLGTQFILNQFLLMVKNKKKE